MVRTASLGQMRGSGYLYCGDFLYFGMFFRIWFGRESESAVVMSGDVRDADDDEVIMSSLLPEIRKREQASGGLGGDRARQALECRGSRWRGFLGGI